MDVDFGPTVGDYATHRAPFPERLWHRLARLDVRFDGARAVDLGTGTGALARALVRRGAEVVGVDRSAEMLEGARALDARAGTRARYVVAPAEDTGLPGGAFDVVTAGQCWWWFDAELAFAEARRLLAPGGALVLASHDWLPLAGSVVEATEALVRRHNPRWTMGGGDGLHTEWLRGAARAGLERLESFSTDVDEPYDHAGWRGRVRASAGVGASLLPEEVAAFDAELVELLERRFPTEPLAVPHRLFAVVARAPRGRG